MADTDSEVRDDHYLEKALSSAFARPEGAEGAMRPEFGSGFGPPASEAPLPDRIGPYRVEALVGRGGMGTVIRVFDADLDRSVALKILHQHLARDPEMLARFEDEARLAAGLEHPGIVPIHGIGWAEDGRPYFTMKLMENGTFAALLAARPAPFGDNLESLVILEQVARITGFAHRRGVLHLDVKPANILVGSYGEILLTDWGFADRSVQTDHPDAPTAPGHLRRVTGTPAYMAPEQAQGNRAAQGTTADVFALGAILCEILTGAPPYARDSSTEALLAASKAWTDKAFAALDACGADARLIDLAQRSLAADPALRPVDGKAFADELADWTQRVHEERRAWEIEAATERHRRRWAWIAALILIAGAIGVSGIWLRAQREHDARLADDRKLAATMAERARVLVQHEWTADAPDPRAWDESIDLAARAQEFSRHRTLGLAIDAELEDLMVRLRRGQDVARTHSDLLKRLTMNCERFGDQTFARQKDREFADIFREVGIEPGITSASAAVAILTAHPCRTALVGALDDWARMRRRAQGKSSELAILELLARVDQDDRRREVRAAMNDAGIERLSGLVHDPAWQDAPAASLLLLANSLRSRDRSDLAKLVLERAQIRFPDQYTVHHELGSMARDATPPQPDEARLHFSMALAARPEDPHALIDLAQVMLQLAEWDRAAAILRRAQHLDPGYAPARHYLGVLAYRLGRPDEAVRELRASLDIDPEPIHTRTVLAMSLLELERGDEAVDELRRVVAGHPEAVESWSILGSALVRQGQFVAAEAALRSGQSADLARGGLLKQPFDGALADLRRHAEAAERLDQIDPRSPPPVGPDQLVVLARTAWFVKRVDLAAQLTQSAIDRFEDEGQTPPFSVDLLSLQTAARMASDAAPGEPAQVKWRGIVMESLDRALDQLDQVAQTDPIARAERAPLRALRQRRDLAWFFDEADPTASLAGMTDLRQRYLRQIEPDQRP